MGADTGWPGLISGQTYLVTCGITCALTLQNINKTNLKKLMERETDGPGGERGKGGWGA